VKDDLVIRKGVEREFTTAIDLNEERKKRVRIGMFVSAMQYCC